MPGAEKQMPKCLIIGGRKTQVQVCSGPAEATVQSGLNYFWLKLEFELRQLVCTIYNTHYTLLGSTLLKKDQHLMK